MFIFQVHQQKTGTQNCTGSLLHLPRFQVERKPKALFLTEKIIEILKTRENCLAEYEEIRKELGLSNSLKKLFKTFDFQRYVKTDVVSVYDGCFCCVIPYVHWFYIISHVASINILMREI
jgi:hypothetical protein